MDVAISTITIDTSGTTPRNPAVPFYCKDELDLLKMIGANGGVQVDVIYNGKSTVGILGTRNGVLLNQPGTLFILPCPPYCKKELGTYTTQNAIAYLSTP